MFPLKRTFKRKNNPSSSFSYLFTSVNIKTLANVRTVNEAILFTRAKWLTNIHQKRIKQTEHNHTKNHEKQILKTYTDKPEKLVF